MARRRLRRLARGLSVVLWCSAGSLLAGCGNGCIGDGQEPPSARTPAVSAEATAPAAESLAVLGPAGPAHPDAVAGEAGVRYKEHRPGTGPAIGNNSRIQAVINVWRPDGTLAWSAGDQPTEFEVALLSREMRNTISRLSQGAVVRVWLPEAALEGWRPPRWPPKTDLIVDMEIVEVSERPPPTVEKLGRAGGAPAAGSAELRYPYPLPDLAGPPADARKVDGVAHVELAPGQAEEGSGKPTSVGTRLWAWSIGGQILTPVAQGLPFSVKLQSAPTWLVAVLAQPKKGQVIRAWLSPTQAHEVFPDQDVGSVIVDIHVDALR